MGEEALTSWRCEVRYRTSFATSPAASAFAPLLFAGDVQAAARSARELGFDGLEINTKGPEELPVHVLKQSLAENGLQLAAIASGRIYLDTGATLTDSDPEARLRVVRRVGDLAGFAAEFGAPIVIGLLRGEHLVDGSPARTTALFVESMQAVADRAAALGIDVYIEAINRYETPLLNTAQETLDALRQIDRPNVKMLLDVFHMNIEEVSIAEAIRLTGRLLGHFHISDSNRRAPGMGHIEFAEIAAALRDIDYRGWISGEHLPLPDSYAAAKQTGSFVKDLFVTKP